MDVKISYTVDLESVPSRTADLLTESSKQLIAARRELEDIISGIHTDRRLSSLLEKIEALRKTLLKVDNSLADSQSLLAGYMQTKSVTAVPMDNIIGGEDDPASA